LLSPDKRPAWQRRKARKRTRKVRRRKRSNIPITIIQSKSQLHGWDFGVYNFKGTKSADCSAENFDLYWITNLTPKFLTSRSLYPARCKLGETPR
jgi:hypothetical protein